MALSGASRRKQTPSSNMKTIFTLFSLVIILALASCGKSREEELKAINNAHASLLVIAEMTQPFLNSASNSSDLIAKKWTMDRPDIWEKTKDMLPDVEGAEKASVKNLKEWFDSTLTHSGKLIKESKPSHNELKEAHKRLSDIHTKFVVIMSEASDPRGSVDTTNENLSDFKQAFREYLAWWKREM